MNPYGPPEPPPIPRFLRTPPYTYRQLVHVGIAWATLTVAWSAILATTGTGAVVLVALLPSLALAAATVASRAWWRLPGLVWALGLLPLAVLTTDRGPVQDPRPALWAAGLAVVSLVAGYVTLLHCLGRLVLSERFDRGEPITTGQLERVQRRPLETALIAILVVAAEAQVDITGFVVFTSLFALLWRRLWTSALAALLSVMAFLLITSQVTNGILRDDEAFPAVYAALAALWVATLFHRQWRSGRLYKTEIAMSLGLTLLRGGYRLGMRAASAVEQEFVSAGRFGHATLSPFYGGGAPRPAPRPATQGGNDTFMRYCANCRGNTPHVSGGFSLPHCTQCAGGRRGDQVVKRHCPNCHGPTEHVRTNSGMRCAICRR